MWHGWSDERLRMLLDLAQLGPANAGERLAGRAPDDDVDRQGHRAKGKVAGQLLR
jgi:hypothetical protein